MPRTNEPWKDLEDFKEWVTSRGENALLRYRNRTLYGLKIEQHWDAETIERTIRAGLLSRRIHAPVRHEYL